MMLIIASTTGSDLRVLVVPAALLLSAVLTFELAAALTISTLPRSRFQQRWTPHERRRVTRLFGTVLLLWPACAGGVAAFLLLPPVWAGVIVVLCVALLGLAMTGVVRALGHRRHVLAGHCTGCLYDLRGSLDRDGCPECGTPLSHHPAIRRLRQNKASVAVSDRPSL